MSKKKEPLISICVGVYNVKQYIEQCLDSILNQDFDDYELIVMDNGSTDGSIQICEEYEKKYPNKIRFIALPLPTIPGRIYYTSIPLIKGQYYMSVDGDDYLTQGSLKRIASIIKADKPDMVMGTFICDAEEGMPYFKDAIFEKEKINKVSYNTAVNYIASIPNFHTVQWRYIVNKEIMIKLNNNKDEVLTTRRKVTYAGRYGDTVHVLFFFLNSKTIRFLEVPFYVYRKRKSSLTGQIFNNNVILDYFKCLFSIQVLMENNKAKYIMNSGIRNLIKSQIESKFSMFRLTCNFMSEKEFQYFANLTVEYREIFDEFKIYDNEELNQLYEFVKKYGNVKGCREYVELQRKDFVFQIQGSDSKEVYIFPTGAVGECTLELLREHHILVQGFLDNDPNKEKIIFGELPCILPERIKSFSDEKRQNMVILISTAYQQLTIDLKKQLLNIGLNENQIIIRK